MGVQIDMVPLKDIPMFPLKGIDMSSILSTKTFIKIVFDARDYAVEEFGVDPGWAFRIALTLKDYFNEVDKIDEVDLKLMMRLWADDCIVNCMCHYIGTTTEVGKLRKLSYNPEVMCLASWYFPRNVYVSEVLDELAQMTRAPLHHKVRASAQALLVGMVVAHQLQSKLI